MRKFAVSVLFLLFMICGAVAANDSQQVVITAKGRKYHRHNCRTVKQYVKMLTVNEAQQLGYKPCKVCKP